jgi:hypothetical protein
MAACFLIEGLESLFCGGLHFRAFIFVEKALFHPILMSPKNQQTSCIEITYFLHTLVSRSVFLPM